MEYRELILDMMNRIIKLEKEVESLKVRENKPFEHVVKDDKKGDASQQRDKTKYLFNGNVYHKNKLVLAVVKSYVEHNPGLSCGELKAAFNKSLQGSIGVVEYETVAKRRNDYSVRFFSREEEILHLADGNMFVCTQWGIGNITNFIKRAEQLGFEIQSIER